jgi:lysophospholipase L1-like esterase
VPLLHYFKHQFLSDRGEKSAADVEKITAIKLDTEREVIAEYNQAARDAAASLSADCIDLVPAFEKAADAKLFVDDCHPNSNGHSIIAQEIFSLIQKMNQAK